jgi:hypothetical protein
MIVRNSDAKQGWRNMQVDIYKPASSKANNSETYILGFGFRGCPDETLRALLRHVGTETFQQTTLLPLAAMPQSFLKSAKAAAVFFAERTRESLQDAYFHNRAPRMWSDMLIGSLRASAQQWIQMFQIKPLAAEARLSLARLAPGCAAAAI